MGATVYRPGMITEKFDALIVGSGVGGLGVGCLLAKTGKRVLVMERHYVAGGFTHTFSRKGYEWDVGVHYIGEVHKASSILRQVFDYVTEGNLKWERMPDVYDRIFFGETCYDYVAGEEAFKERMIGYFPGEADAIMAYVDLIKLVNKRAKRFFLEKALPSSLRFATAPFMLNPFWEYSDQTTAQVLASLTSNRELQAVLAAQFGDYGLPPAQSSFAIHALVAKHYLNGASYPVGGSAQIADTMIPVIEAAGGRVLVKAEVSEIVLEGKKAMGVKTNFGETLLADCVISDAGVVNTFAHLLPPDTRDRFRVHDHLKQITPSAAHVGVYLGFKELDQTLGLQPANCWIYPDYDHDGNLQRYLQNPKAPLPVAYVSFPSAKDPSFATRHPGRATMEVVGFAPYDWFKPWEGKPWMKRGLDYEANKQILLERYLEVVYRYFPQVKGKVDYMELSTPLSTKHFSNYQTGEIYGIDHTPDRFRLDWLRPKTAIKNLYLTGQDIVTNGVGGALMGAVLSASAILKENILKRILKS